MKSRPLALRKPEPLPEVFAVDSQDIADEWNGIKVGQDGSMKWASFSIGEHVAAGIVFGETQKEADQRARRIVDGANATKEGKA